LRLNPEMAKELCRGIDASRGEQNVFGFDLAVTELVRYLLGVLEE